MNSNNSQCSLLTESTVSSVVMCILGFAVPVVIYSRGWHDCAERQCYVQDGAEAEYGHQGFKGPPVCLAAAAPRRSHVVLLPGATPAPSHCIAIGAHHLPSLSLLFPLLSFYILLWLQPNDPRLQIRIWAHAPG